MEEKKSSKKENRKAKTKQSKKWIKNSLITFLFLGFVVILINLAPNYIRENSQGKVHLIINNTDVTKGVKNDIKIEDGIIYLSISDVENYFDGFITYDSQNDQILTGSKTKFAAMPMDNSTIEINSSKIDIYALPKKEDDIYYVPISQMGNIYNIETSYIESSDTVTIDSLDRKKVQASSFKNMSVKYKPTAFSKTVDKIKKGDNVYITQKPDGTGPYEKNGWIEVRTKKGILGYVKKNNLTNEYVIRDNMNLKTENEEKISLVWDYYSEYVSAPDRNSSKIDGVNVVSPAFFSLNASKIKNATNLNSLGKSFINENVGEAGRKYIQWAHDNGYEVWPMLSNSTLGSTEQMHKILSDYNTREVLINAIVDTISEYNVDGLNMDFENMQKDDKDNYSRLIIELAPRLREIGLKVSVDVTAPDGSETWSLCFDRYTLGKASDYLVFMAYDQHGASSKNAGSVASYDWVESNINKFLKQEEVDSSKIILGIPFYTRIWEVNDQLNLDSSVSSMKNTYSQIPESATITWNDEAKQNIAVFNKDGKNYKVWIEDEKSITEKLGLVGKYNLAGAGFWAKDRETDSVWKIVSEKLGV